MHDHIGADLEPGQALGVVGDHDQQPRALVLAFEDERSAVALGEPHRPLGDRALHANRRRPVVRRLGGHGCRGQGAVRLRGGGGRVGADRQQQRDHRTDFEGDEQPGAHDTAREPGAWVVIRGHLDGTSGPDNGYE